MFSDDALLQFPDSENSLALALHGNNASFSYDFDEVVTPFARVPSMVSIEVRHVFSLKGGLEVIENNQMRTEKDHGGRILVHTIESGYGEYWPDVRLAGKRMKPFHFDPIKQEELYKQFDSPILNAAGTVVGWNRVWEMDRSEGGGFYINTWSVNGPHIHPHVSDYLFIV